MLCFPLATDQGRRIKKHTSSKETTQGMNQLRGHRIGRHEVTVWVTRRHQKTSGWTTRSYEPGDLRGPRNPKSDDTRLRQRKLHGPHNKYYSSKPEIHGMGLSLRPLRRTSKQRALSSYSLPQPMPWGGYCSRLPKAQFGSAWVLPESIKQETPYDGYA